MILYALDPSVAAFQALRYSWTREVAANHYLALLSAYSRDGLLRMSAPYILSLKENEVIDRDAFEEFLKSKGADRLSNSCLESLVRNIAGTWARSGHLVKASKRSIVKASVGSVGVCLFSWDI